jgi:adenine phosphoribosyltransferase
VCTAPRLFEIKPGLRIAILNILGDTELVTACSIALAEKLSQVEYDILVTAEAKSIPLAHGLSIETGKPYVILRKSYKPYMGDALRAETLSITTGQPQTLYLTRRTARYCATEGDHPDDVISTGSTLQGMRMLLQKAGALVVTEAPFSPRASAPVVLSFPWHLPCSRIKTRTSPPAPPLMNFDKQIGNDLIKPSKPNKEARWPENRFLLLTEEQRQN